MKRGSDVEASVRRASRFCRRDRCTDALALLEKALGIDPNCYDALVMAGELYCMQAPELGFEKREGDLRALDLFDRAIAARPGDAEAHNAKALALLHLGDWQEAIACVDRGFEKLGDCPGDWSPQVWQNIAESLYRTRALALKGARREDEGRDVLAEGLRRFPSSEYLRETEVEWDTA